MMNSKRPTAIVRMWATLLGLALGLGPNAPSWAQEPRFEAGGQVIETQLKSNQSGQPPPPQSLLYSENPYHRPERLIQGYRELQTLRREWDQLARNRDELLDRLQRARGALDNDDYSDNTILNRPVIDRLLARMHQQVGLENDLIEKAGRIVLMIGTASPSWEGAIRGGENSELHIPEAQRQVWLKALDSLAENDRRQFTQVLLGSRLGSAVTSRLSGRLWDDIEEDRRPLAPPNTPEMRQRWQDRLLSLERRNRILREQLEAQNEEIRLMYSFLSDKPLGDGDDAMVNESGGAGEGGPEENSIGDGPEMDGKDQ